MGDPALNTPGDAYDSVNDILYAISGATDSLYTQDTTTGALTLVGPLGVNVTINGGTHDPSTGCIFMSAGNTLYRVEPTTGAATAVGPIGVANVNGLALSP